MNVFRAALSSDFWITGIANSSLRPSGLSYKANRWESLFHGGEAAGVSAACRECDAEFAAQVGNHGSRPDASPSQPCMRRFARLLRSSRRELSDLPNAFQMDSR